jgi:hypothetical protein
MQKALLLLLSSIALYASTSEVQKAEEMHQEIVKMQEYYETMLVQEKRKNEALQKRLNMAMQALDGLKNRTKKKKKFEKPKPKLFCEDQNRFPSLKRKSASKKSISFFKASVFRLKNSAKIYDDFENPNYIMQWEEGRSFTSNQKADGWIKITGYFVNKKWKAAHQELWVRSEDVIQRESSR